jgi:hypothetical protein
LRFSVENTHNVTAGYEVRSTSPNIVKLLGATLIDFTWVAQASLAGMAAISIQDDANVRHRPPFELIEEPALINPIKETERQRRGRAFVRWLSLSSVPPGVEPGRGNLLING